MSSLSDKEIHTQNMSSGWEHLYNIEKYMLLSCAFTSFFHFSNNSPSSPQNPFNLVQFCLCFSKLGFFFCFSSGVVFSGTKQEDSINIRVIATVRTWFCGRTTSKKFLDKFHEKSGSIDHNNDKHDNGTMFQVFCQSLEI